MKKYPLITIAIFTLIIIVLGSLTNVVGYQTVQTTQHRIISERSDLKELMFQTFIDIMNNKDIKSIILEYKKDRYGFLNPNMKFSSFTLQILTKSQLRWMYFIGLLLSKSINQSRIQNMMKQYQSIAPEMQTQITNVIRKDSILSTKISQLENSECDCKNEYPTQWNFPVICFLLYPFMILSIAFYLMYGFDFLYEIIRATGSLLHCNW